MKAKQIKFRIFFTVVLSLFLLLIFYSCADDRTETNEIEVREKNIRDSIYADSLKQVAEQVIVPPLVIKYRLDSLSNDKIRDSILGLYSEEQKNLIYALNRIEAVRVGVGTNLLIPDTLLTDFNKYSPFPAILEILDSIPKTVLISQRVQAFGLYEKGRLIKWGPVSSGKQSTPTPNGLHYGNYKAKRKVSTVNKDWILPYYFNFMNFEGVGVHQYLLPGFPASHACVRLYMEDAQFIYDWAQQWQLDPSGQKIVQNGTPFMVFGEYDYERPFPWLDLVENPEANALSEEEKTILRSYMEDYLKDERNFVAKEKDSVVAIEG